MTIVPLMETYADGYILHERERRYYGEGKGLLSIKTFFSGQALYAFGNSYHAVDDAVYLVVNHDQPYTVTIDAKTPVESFCLFFGYHFANDVYRSLTASPSYLLDEPLAQRSAPLQFFERTYSHDNLLSPLLFHTRTVLQSRRYERSWLHEQFHALMQALLQSHFNVYRELEMLPALRMTTREELYRRLYLARDYMDACFDTPITLDKIACIAALSPNHFLRMFKQLFRQTPHQYLISKRLARACHLLASTDDSVTDICFALGFESPSSFSWLFHQRIGCSPTAYRKKSDF